MDRLLPSAVERAMSIQVLQIALTFAFLSIWALAGQIAIRNRP